MEYVHGQLYYWLSLFVNFALPFVFLLIMNSVIIHTLRQRSLLKIKHEISTKESSVSNDNHRSNFRSSETQIFAILLLVTFGFLLLTTPAYAFFLYVKFVNYHKSPESFAEFYLFYNFAHKLYYTNYGINFFLYVISGKKFRSDLVKLFRKKSAKPGENSVDRNTVSSSIEFDAPAS